MQPIVGGQKPQRNQPCSCGSGLKYKKCHGDPAKKQACVRAMRVAAEETMAKLIYEETNKNG